MSALPLPSSPASSSKRLAAGLLLSALLHGSLLAVLTTPTPAPPPRPVLRLTLQHGAPSRPPPAATTAPSPQGQPRSGKTPAAPAGSSEPRRGWRIASSIGMPGVDSGGSPPPDFAATDPTSTWQQQQAMQALQPAAWQQLAAALMHGPAPDGDCQATAPDYRWQCDKPALGAWLDSSLALATLPAIAQLPGLRVQAQAGVPQLLPLALPAQPQAEQVAQAVAQADH